jgi:hypothetical protein
MVTSGAQPNRPLDSGDAPIRMMPEDMMPSKARNLKVVFMRTPLVESSGKEARAGLDCLFESGDAAPAVGRGTRLSSGVLPEETACATFVPPGFPCPQRPWRRASRFLFTPSRAWFQQKTRGAPTTGARNAPRPLRYRRGSEGLAHCRTRARAASSRGTTRRRQDLRQAQVRPPRSKTNRITTPSGPGS